MLPLSDLGTGGAIPWWGQLDYAGVVGDTSLLRLILTFLLAIQLENPPVCSLSYAPLAILGVHTLRNLYKFLCDVDTKLPPIRLSGYPAVIFGKEPGQA